MAKLSLREAFTLAKDGFTALRQDWGSFENMMPYTATGLKVAATTGALALGLEDYSSTLSTISMTAFAISLFGSIFLVGRQEAAKLDNTNTVQNDAGQNANGLERNLRRLGMTQKRITQLTQPFNQSSDLPADVQAKVDALIAAKKSVVDAVKIVDAQGAEIVGEKYKFTRAKQTMQVLN